MSTLAPPINLAAWIDEHRHLLRPPVGNKVIWRDADTIVMVVGGPNARADYHINDGEEVFHQLEGDITLKVVDDGAFRDIPIRAGEVFLLPPRVPHSPQRPAGSVGIVIERARRPEQQDGFRWYCPQCRALLYEEFFHVSDIEAQLAALMQRFWSDAELRTCKLCGAVLERPSA